MINNYSYDDFRKGWWYREWAPAAYQLYLEGDFNNWNQTEYPMKRLENGIWELFLEGEKTLWEGCKVKTIVGTIGKRIYCSKYFER